MGRYYVSRSAGPVVVLELRQERFREQRRDGGEHPHDVCAVGRDVAELRETVRLLGPEAVQAVDEYEP